MATETETPKSLPRINEPAPDFTAQSTQGEIKLSSYRGKKWVVLFSHPADFTPVCTTEFVAFSKLWPEFEKRNVQLIGLSVDSIYSHIGWLNNIEQNFGVKVLCNMDEILRLVDALQTVDKNGVATPANWRPGDAVIVPAPVTKKEGAEKRKAEGYEYVDWYFSKKKL